jgi:hypothetical protein
MLDVAVHQDGMIVFRRSCRNVMGDHREQKHPDKQHPENSPSCL